MKLLLIRHGETEHNVAGLLAGVTDSALTNHGILQIHRLGKSLAARGLCFTHIFSSDLQRAFMTANAICDAQNDSKLDHPQHSILPTHLTILREQDFGSYECRPWAARRPTDTKNDQDPKPDNPGFTPKETSEAMTKRSETFLDNYVVPLLATDQEEENRIAIVSHGIFLSVLWRSLLRRFGPHTVCLSQDISEETRTRSLEYIPGWSNTGYLEIDISTAKKLPAADYGKAEVSITPEAAVEMKADDARKLIDGRMVVRAMNRKDHLNNLKRTGGGLGSSTFDPRQKRLERFFPGSTAPRSKNA